MKKLSYMLSALLAAVGFSSAASADVSVSGSGSLTISSDGANTETILASGIAFALSSTTANGMTISTSGSISNGSASDGTASAGGFSSVAFATGGSTITVGKVEVPNGVGDVGPAASDMTKQGRNTNHTSNSSFGVNGTVEAAGVSLATAVGGASVTIGYVYNTGVTSDGDINGSSTTTGVSFSMPVGNITTTLGYVTDGTQNQSGASAALALGGGTLTVGYGQTSASAANETSMGASYAMSLDADTSMTVGYNSTKGTTAHTKSGIALSRSIGGGASVFLEAINYAGAGASQAGTDIGIGTSFAF